MCRVYMFENNINHHKYIGASKHIEQRYKEHLRDVDGEAQKKKTLYKAFRKYGIENFTFSVIEECAPHPKGDEYPNSLISEAIASKIIQDLANTRFSFAQIAERNSCSEDIVKDINIGKTHKYLHNYGSNIREEMKKNEV